MSNLKNKLEAIKNKEVAASIAKSHEYVEGDVLRIAGVTQKKSGKEKVILADRLFVVASDSKKGDMIRGILLDNNGNLQNCVIALPVSVMTKVGRYTEEGQVALDSETSETETSETASSEQTKKTRSKS